MQGFTQNYIRVTAKYDPLLINEVKRVQLASINSHGLAEVTDLETEVLTH
jgi:threonylcarbamoyladenosine tRNA methylthiotransferase MtaB